MPLYYARDAKLGYSPEWVALCKRSMTSVLPAFNSERVLRDYLHEFYAPAARQGRVMATENFQAARELGAWKDKVRAAWPGVALKLLSTPATEISFAEHVTLEVDVTLNGLAPADVCVECQAQPVLGSEVVVPVQGYAENRRPINGVSYLEGRAVFIETVRGRAPSTPPVSAVTGSSSNRRGPAPWSTRCGPCPTIRTFRIRTSSA